MSKQSKSIPSPTLLRQRDFIKKNLVALVKSTKNWDMLSSKLVGNGLFDRAELQQLGSIEDIEVEDTAKFTRLYWEVQKGQEFWDKLKKSLADSGNVAAVEILNRFTLT